MECCFEYVGEMKKAMTSTLDTFIIEVYLQLFTVISIHIPVLTKSLSQIVYVQVRNPYKSNASFC